MLHAFFGLVVGVAKASERVTILRTRKLRVGNLYAVEMPVRSMVRLGLLQREQSSDHELK